MPKYAGRPVFFEDGNVVASFDKAITDSLRLQHRQNVRERLSEENMQRFMHGTAWSSPSQEDDIPSNMKTLSTGWKVKFDDIIAGDLSVVGRSIQRVSEEMKRQFETMLYSTISDTCERSGNIVDAKTIGSLAASFLEMIRKIELNVGRDGTVQMPEIHASPETAEKIISELNSQPPEFRAEIERIKAEKTAEAFSRETERKAQFKRYPQ